MGVDYQIFPVIWKTVRQISERVTELLNEYAIIHIRQSQIPDLVQIVEVEYVEKPKRLFFQVRNGKRVSCINEVQDARFSLTGHGVLVAVIDSGVDYTLPDFRNEDGTTRIRYLWDQSLKAVEGEHVPKEYGMGVEYTKEEIDAAFPDFYHVITPKNIVTQGAITIRTRDISGHGTAVAAIAAGNGRGSGGVYAGVAPQSEFIVVKLGNPMSGGFPRTTELMQGIDYVIRKAQELRMPVAVNISFGNTYGARDGTSLLERFIDDISNIWKSCICIGTGNEGATAGHTSGRLREKDCGRAKYREQESIRKCQSKYRAGDRAGSAGKTAIVKCSDLEKICRSDRYFNCIAYRYTYRTSQGAAWNTAIYCRCNRNTFVLRGAKSI